MVKAKELNIKIVAAGGTDDTYGADVFINGRYYYLDHTKLKSEQDLRTLLAVEPDYIYNVVILMLKEMANEV